MAKIGPVLNEISGALSALATQIVASIGDDRTFMEIWQWQQPGVTRHDISDKIQNTISIIQNANKDADVDPPQLNRLSLIPAAVQYFQANSLPNMPGGNSHFVVNSLFLLLESIENQISDYLPKEPDWQEIQDRNLLPAQLKKRLDALSRGLANIEKQYGEIDGKLSAISDAYQAASDLPASLAGLDDAKNKYEGSQKEITDIVSMSGKSLKEIEKHKELIEKYRVQCYEISGEIDEVYRAATRQGLGKSFHDRSSELKNSTYILMALLFVTLGIGAYISHERMKFVEGLLDNENLSFQVIWANIALTAIGVAAPIWFAWLLTRQIGHRFRLAEDYGFKASVAKAYEGYRREVQESGDAELQTRLLGIAIDRIEEAPLDQIKADEAASPLHDFFKSRMVAKPNASSSDGG